MSIPLFFAGNRASAWTPRNLFAAGEQGAWYDPSDLSTLFQDSAGTTPVTAVEQPVGLMLDKSGRGNHATASADANRPTLSARYNLLTKTEDFSDAVWTKGGATVSTDATAAPTGAVTADKIIPSTASAAHYVTSFNKPAATGPVYRSTIFAKAAGYNWIGLSDATTGQAVFNLTTGAVESADAGITAETAVDAGNGWWRLSITYTASSPRGLGVDVWSDNAKTTFAGDGTKGVYLWGADLRVANESASIPAYQRVDTSTSYDTAGFPPYLSFNGTNSAMATASIDFTATDKMTVVAGIRKLSDAARGMLLELGDGSLINGEFQIDAPVGASASYYVDAGGTTLRGITLASGYPAPISNVLTMTDDISGSSLILRLNGAQVGSNANSQGTGNFSNAALYLGARGGSSLWFNGRLYSLIVRGAATSAADIVRAESWVNVKSGSIISPSLADPLLLLEDGAYLLQESGDKIKLE